VKKYVNDNYDASKYKDLGGPNTVWLVMPSTSGQNTIPRAFAERLAADHGGAVITDGFSMDQTGQAKNKRGYMAKMDALPQVDIHDPALLAKLAGKKVVIVDDIMTSGVTSDALTEALAAKGIQTKATAVLAAVKDGAPAHPSQLKELAQTIAESTGRPLKEVLAQVKLVHGGSRGKLVVEALREAREHPKEVYERITRKAETLRTSSRGGN
jgi:hypoxanthine phosphoribosyltransferase